MRFWVIFWLTHILHTLHFTAFEASQCCLLALSVAGGVLYHSWVDFQYQGLKCPSNVSAASLAVGLTLALCIINFGLSRILVSVNCNCPSCRHIWSSEVGG